LAAAILVISNIFFFSGLASANAPVNELRVSLSGRMKELGHYSVLSELPYDYRSAFRAAKDSGYAGKLFVAGATYGVFGEIMNGFAIAEARAGAAIYRSVPPLFNAADINRNNAIELVLISDFFEGDSLRGDLADLGWRPWRNFRNNSFGSTIFGLIRPEPKK